MERPQPFPTVPYQISPREPKASAWTKSQEIELPVLSWRIGSQARGAGRQPEDPLPVGADPDGACAIAGDGEHVHSPAGAVGQRRERRPAHARWRDAKVTATSQQALATDEHDARICSACSSSDAELLQVDNVIDSVDCS